MFSGRITECAIRALDWLTARTLSADQSPVHQQTGRRGEEAAYFHLRQLGYVMVARNFRSPRRRGEIDLVAWENGVLCFIEVKTRTTRDVKPAHLAVDRDKQHELIAMAYEYLRLLRARPAWRIDILSVYLDKNDPTHAIELFRNAFPAS